MNLKTVLAMIVIPVLAAGAENPSVPGSPLETQCMKCHLKLLEKYSQPAILYPEDIHFQAGLKCSDCHGGIPDNERRHDRKDPSQGFLGKPAVKDIPSFCDRCHGSAEYMRSFNPGLPVDQLTKYRTSLHGQRLFTAGDLKVATCVSCHSVHDIRNPKDPRSSVYSQNIPSTCATCHADQAYMAGYKIPTNQYELFAGSVHGVALLERGDQAAPACNGCHGNHGAMPPQVKDISHVCGLCHAQNADLYNASLHAPIFQEQGLPGCESCHGNHGIVHPSERFLGAGEESVCGTCHQVSPPDSGFQLSLRMKASLDSLSTAWARDTLMVGLAEQRGMEVSELRFTLRDVRQNLIEARTLVHTFEAKRVEGQAGKGLALAAQVADAAIKALDEHKSRRWWLGLVTLVLVLIILGLYLKMREIEKG